jgi:hypothetical protein
LGDSGGDSGVVGFAHPACEGIADAAALASVQYDRAGGVSVLQRARELFVSGEAAEALDELRPCVAEIATVPLAVATSISVTPRSLLTRNGHLAQSG